MKRAKSLRAVLAAGTARVRAERGLSEEQAAQLLRSYGLVTWRVGTLTQVEAGVRPLAVEELLLLCAAYRVSVAELAGTSSASPGRSRSAGRWPRSARPSGTRPAGSG